MASPIPQSGPAASQPAPGTRVEVRFEPAGRSVSVPVGTSLLDAARTADQPIARGCGAEGRCSRCGVEVLRGSVPPESEREATVKQRNRIAPELRLACRIEVEDDLVVTAPYW